MNYTNKSFSVISAGTKEYRDNWERTFGRSKTEEPQCELTFGIEGHKVRCERPEGHTGYCFARRSIDR